ncbi:MAG: membrane protein insertase YidC [Elusimicrobiota bacterium]
MDNNLLLAVALSVAVYGLWFGIVEKKIAPTAVESTSLLGQLAPASGMLAPTIRTASENPQQLLRTPIFFKLGLDRIGINPYGAGIASYRYRDGSNWIELVEDSASATGLLSTWPEIAFHQDAAAQVPTFSARLPNDLRITKQFIAGDGATLPEVKITFSNPGNHPLETGAWAISVGPGLNTIASEQKENPKVWRALGLSHGTDGLNGSLDIFKNARTTIKNFRWVGVDNRYFLAAIIPTAGDFSSVTSGLPPSASLNAPNSVIGPHAEKTASIPFYIGPKGMIWLSHFHLGLERSINFGFFSPVGRALMKALYWINKFTGNWGWSIIILTMLIQLMLFPLSYKSFKSMALMKKIQPEIARLQQIYAKDPSKLNQEMMGVYKKHGVNPASGCLPMVVQFPVFFALYYALRAAWELHGAGWMFWIKDLSARDPYFILPLVMGGAMFLQNKFNPTVSDPTQAQIMTWMPIVFTFMFLYFPSGLVLYYLTSNLCTLAMQTVFRKRMGLDARSA